MIELLHLRAPVTRAALALAVALAAAGCGGETDTSGTTTTTTTETSACADDSRVQVYKVGLKGSSDDGSVVITFLDADPAPPSKGNNTWVVKVADAAGKAITGAAIETKAYMPDHGHSSSIKPTATEMGADGTYEITPINLFMPGVWEVTLTVTPSGGTATPVKFTFCVAG